jgi:hypothetical protein
VEGEGPSADQNFGRERSAERLHTSPDSLYRTARGKRQQRPGVVPLDRLPRRCPVCGNTTRSSATDGACGTRTTTATSASGFDADSAGPATRPSRSCLTGWCRSGTTACVAGNKLASEIACGDSAEQCGTLLPRSGARTRLLQRTPLGPQTIVQRVVLAEDDPGGRTLFAPTHHPRLGFRRFLPHAVTRGEKSMNRKALDELKQQIPLLDYLKAQEWRPARPLSGGRWMGLALCRDTCYRLTHPL